MEQSWSDKVDNLKRQIESLELELSAKKAELEALYRSYKPEPEPEKKQEILPSYPIDSIPQEEVPVNPIDSIPQEEVPVNPIDSIADKEAHITELAKELFVHLNNYFMLLPDSNERISRFMLLSSSIVKREKTDRVLKNRMITILKSLWSTLKASSGSPFLRSIGETEAKGVDTHVRNFWNLKINGKEHWALKTLAWGNMGRMMAGVEQKKDRLIIELFYDEIVMLDSILQAPLLINDDIKKVGERLQVYHELVKEMRKLVEPTRFGGGPRTRNIASSHTDQLVRNLWSKPDFALSKHDENEWKNQIEMSEILDGDRERVYIKLPQICVKEKGETSAVKVKGDVC